MGDIPRWYALHTKPAEEDRADANLKSWSVETFAPKVKAGRPPAAGTRSGGKGKHLFPQYIFARFDLNRLLHNVRFTRGVDKVVSFGSAPVPVDDEIIELIRSQQGADGFIEIRERFEAGELVVVKDGPLKNLAGCFTREVDDFSRIEILLTAISYQGRAIVGRESIRKSAVAAAAR
jgi:transcriptional antiterminator RfaH